MPKFTVPLLLALSSLLPSLAQADYDVLVPMKVTGGGNYLVSASFGGTEDSTFLIDTGASLSTISRTLLRKIEAEQEVTHVRRIAARLANGKFQTADVYRISNFVIGSLCEIDSVEVAVMPHKGRNILGMNVLAMTAPFGLNLDKNSLAVSQCQPRTFNLDASLAIVE